MKTYSFLFIFLMAILSGNIQQEKKSGIRAYQEANTIDGPYVLYSNDSIVINYIEENNGIKSVRQELVPVSMKNSVKLKVGTDIPGKSFEVSIKDKLENEKSEYNRARKMLVISDIEGNFGAFRKLLIAGGVMDDNFNWTFGKDHLVLVGDFVDRGEMVMETLWLIYSLEEQAKSEGGYVHFILGNHEIMNMSGDLNYVNEKYLKHAELMNKHYMHLVGADAELGRWLATKNIAERVGNILFMHGGFSSYMNNIKIYLDDLNKISRPYYADSTFSFKDPRLELIFSDYGPFWYRGYYMKPRAEFQQLDSTLNFYGVRYITTGHTIVANEIASLYRGRLLDTDVHHADGHSEALLYENGKFWRITPKGERLEVKTL